MTPSDEPTNGSMLSFVRKYSDNRCQAIIKVNSRWTRCGVSPIEVHHRITRSRGGRVLDEAGEFYHLMALCREHHAFAHMSIEGYRQGLLIEGYVTSDGAGVHYSGPDEYLTNRYP